MSRDRIRDMKRAMCSLAIVLAAALTVDLGAQRRNAAGAGAAVDVDTALKTVVPDLDKRLARFKVVRMPFAGASVTLRVRQSPPGQEGGDLRPVRAPAAPRPGSRRPQVP